MPKRTMETLDRETQQAKEDEVRDRLTGFLRKNVTDPGILAVLVDHKEHILLAMFTYNLTTIMNPSDHAVDVAFDRLEGNEQYKKMNDRDKFFNIKHFACGTDKGNRKLAGGTIVQAIMSCAAGLNIIMHSDDRNLDSKEISKKLNWNRQSRGTMRITETVYAAMGYVSGIDNTAMEAFDPAVFERDFLVKLNKELPALHFVQTLNKIVVYDIKEGDTFAEGAWLGPECRPTTYNTTTEVNTPTFPLPF